VKDAVGWPRTVPSHEPLARALSDHARTGRHRSLRVRRPGGVHYALSTEEFFELSGEQAPIDEAILEASRGRVLDVGAGAGRHALALQERGLEVVAVDVSPICVDLMRTRGVADARETDVWSVVEGAQPTAPFDTVLFAMQSIGITGTIEGLERMLRALAAPHSRAPVPGSVSPHSPASASGGVSSRSPASVSGGVSSRSPASVSGGVSSRSPASASGVLARGGCVLLDSSPPIGPGFVRRIELAGADPDRSAEPDGWIAGEANVSFDYRGLRGEPFGWIYVGAEALAAIAAECGFDTEILVRLDHSPEYLARLTRSSERDENPTGAGV